MVERILLAILVVGCSSSHTTISARTDCSTCHTAPAVTDPVAAPCSVQDHSTYAATCYQCHGTTQWCPAVPAAMGHPDFDITRASHAGWDCADCHPARVDDPPTLPGKGDPLTCISCHWHSQDETDPRHLGKSNYTYGPTTCLQQGCHGRGGRQ